MTENAPAPVPAPVETGTETRRRRHDEMPWLGGAILIIAGVVILLGNVTGFQLNNWWALFILIPAIGSLAAAWRVYQANGRLTGAASGELVGGLILVGVACMFLFNLDWGALWPFLLILGGIGILSRALIRD